MTQKQDATDLVFEMLEKACANSEITLALQGGRIWLDSERGTIVLEVVDTMIGGELDAH